MPIEVDALMLMPPKVVDLVWTLDVDDEYTARFTKPFGVLWTGDTQIDLLMAMGFNVRTAKDADDRPFHQVRWNPHVAIRYAGYAAELAHMEEVNAEAIAYARAQQRGMDQIARERRNSTAPGQPEPKSRDELISRIRDFADDFGALLVDRDRQFVEDLIRSRSTYPERMKRFERIVDRKNHAIHEFFVARLNKDVPWDDETVIRAAKHLTALDLDKTKFRNGKGWDVKDTSWGHWATAQFRGPEHKMAVSVAKFLVGHYANRQLRGIAP